ncbi:DUF3667 domain-containing protein [Chryseobacterium sp.]|uniref:DUF3667 domain-containing protein n=1 Tax=Chryseobacterium sp. TaxID=1871047 RepID=UPI0025C2A364|nr:DUF3667 domain-containing protein [Chryseobacterium sp.]
MSHGKIREDNTCLNCGYGVPERFCPHCGQENIETRQPFHYLFTHFIEDFTHYDGQFWKTINYLLLRPGKLTKEYLAGKRQQYVAPVKLYIFISFITFLLPGLIPEYKESKEPPKPTAEETRINQENVKKAVDNLQKEGILSHKNAQDTRKLIDSIQSDAAKSKVEEHDDLLDNTFDSRNSLILDAHNIREYDSLHIKTGNPLYKYMRPFAKKMFDLKEEGLSKKEIGKRFRDTFIHTLPKALFIYLPVFAFFLWLFHNKKRWWYFDHGIFTLHFFSFLLLGTLAFILLGKISSILPNYSLINLLSILAYFVLTIYISLYFFIAHHRVYETRKRISILKGMLLFIINSIGLTIMLLALLYASFIMIH